MKKLLIAAAMVCAATVSQAVAVNWSTGEMQGPGATGGWSGDILADTTDYTVTLSFWYFDSESQKISLGTSTSDEFDTDGYAQTSTTDVFAKGGTFYGIASIASNDGKYTLDSKEFTFDIDGQYAADFYDIILGDGGDAISLTTGDLDETWGAWDPSGWKTVPEPTSGLLMLLGMGALALRRRRA